MSETTESTVGAVDGSALPTAAGERWSLTVNDDEAVLRVLPNHRRREVWRVGAILTLIVVLGGTSAEITRTGDNDAVLAACAVALVLASTFLFPVRWALGRGEIVTVTPEEWDIETRLAFGRRRMVVERRGRSEIVLAAMESWIPESLLPPRFMLAYEGEGRRVLFAPGLDREAARDAADALGAAVEALAPRAGPRGEAGVPGPTGGQVVSGIEPVPPPIGRRPPTQIPFLTAAATVACFVGMAGLGVMVARAPFRVAGWTAVFASILLGAGVLGAQRVIGPAVVRRRMRTRRRSHPAEPWAWSGEFDEGVRVVRAFARLLRDPSTWMALVFLAVAWGGGVGGLAYLSVLFTLLAAPPCIRIWNVAFAGETELRWERIPVHPGERLEVRFATGRDGARFDDLRFRLRRLEQRGTSVAATHEARFAPLVDVARLGPDEAVSAWFDLPESVPGTDLTSKTPSWWEIEVWGETSCGVYTEFFPAPVFDGVDGDGAISPS